MSIAIQIIPHTLHFKQPAGTSRGVYKTRKVWYVHIYNREQPSILGYGECAPLPDLSCDATPEYATILKRFASEFSQAGEIDWEALSQYPSMLFGFEIAHQHYQRQTLQLWDSPFSKGEKGIPINGLIWMAPYENMLQQIEVKLKQGFRLLKLKIGAIDFEQELDLLQFIRKKYSPQEIQLRVDANGAFAPDEAMSKLERLAKLGIHSIEQPIPPKLWKEMARLTQNTPIPIALDEDLIGINKLEEKQALLDTVSPQYIILKPSLHGGLLGCKTWIREATLRGIGWWITSALESNIGLNAIAQWTATLNPTLPQGLGTGMLFTDNIPLPLSIRQDQLWFNPQEITPIEIAQ